MFPRPQRAQESPGELFRTQTVGPYPWRFRILRSKLGLPRDADVAWHRGPSRSKVKSLFLGRVCLSECFGLQVTEHPTNSGAKHKDVCLLTKKSLGRQSQAILEEDNHVFRDSLCLLFCHFGSFSSLLMVTGWLLKLQTSHPRRIARKTGSKVAVVVEVIAKVLLCIS